ncbi:acyltransferase [Bacillus sp. NP157]|nr:acyltransferase [Bacillus sp. NP157]
MSAGKNLASLNVFRALAAFWVVVAHCQIWGGAYLFPIPGPKNAVDLFMMISGFLMARTSTVRWIREPLDESSARLSFWIRRYFRLAPVLYVSIGVAIVFAPIICTGLAWLQEANRRAWPTGGVYDANSYDFSIASIVAHALFVSGVIPRFTASLPLPDWSLSLEAQFYLAFPFIVVASRRIGIGRAVAAVMVIAWALNLFFVPTVRFYEPSFLSIKLEYFLAGFLLFHAIDTARPWQERLGLAFFGSMLVTIETHMVSSPLIAVTLYLCVAVTGFLETHDRLPAWLHRVAHSRVVTFAAESSYAVYLVHGLFLGVVGFMLREVGAITWTLEMRTIALLLVVPLVSYAAAWFLVRWIELPGIRLGSRIIERIAVRQTDRVTAPRRTRATKVRTWLSRHAVTPTVAPAPIAGPSPAEGNTVLRRPAATGASCPPARE